MRRRRAPARTIVLVPVSGPALAAAHRGDDGTCRQVAALLGDGGAEHLLAAGRAGQPLGLLRGGALLGEQQRSGSVHGQRHRGDPAPDLDEHAAELEEPETRPVVLLRDGEGQQSRVAQGRPEVAVEAVARLLDLLEPLVGGAVAQDACGQLGRLVLLGGEREVHLIYLFAAGRPRPT